MRHGSRKSARSNLPWDEATGRYEPLTAVYMDSLKSADQLTVRLSAESRHNVIDGVIRLILSLLHYDQSLRIAY